MEYWTILLSIVIGSLGIHYLFRNYNFFKRHGVIHYTPSVPILGAMTSVIFRRTSVVDFIDKIYNFNPNAKYFGVYATTNPVFWLRDPEIIKSILVKNFEAFPDRRGFADLNEPLLANNLFSIRGQKWRDVRALLSPSFTSSKMKMMFTLMSECAVDFANFLSTSVPAEKSDMEIKDAFTKYTNDVIATCAFGIKIDSMKDPTNKFYVYGKEATSFFVTRTFKFLLLSTFPTLGRILDIKLIDDHVSGFFKDIIKTTIATRDAENITRPDMIQLMMDIRGKEGRRELNIDDMTAQAFIFFFGGFDTTSTAMSFVAHELAANPDVQIKLRQEIDKVLEESNGEVTYETINQFEYLDLVINETLRLYPPVAFLERICDKAYELPPALPGEKPFTMKKGMICWIPVFAIHHDAKYYDDPEKFRPERFLDNKMYHNSSFYMPFGLGPRMCIANRFAMLEVKVLLFHLLARCELKPCAKTTLPLKFQKGLIMMPEGGFWLNVQRRSDMHPTLESTMANDVAKS
ncbi:cytochrome p450 9e2 [Lasius niger]|uniref:Cytochrome p450 9e2 n=1 Tax=Lasius niger TaxID=67767 RepID=A0A0J7KPW3_LASNI|nr:cytochrome p450 9e2 [Lasius niger]